jgi:small-conductance mechanosensitive channel
MPAHNPSIPYPGHPRQPWLGLVVALGLLASSAVFAGQNIVAEGVPVTHRGTELYRIYSPYGLLTAAERAARVEARLDGAVDNPEYDPALLTVADGERDAEISYAGNIVAVITDADARPTGRTRLEQAAFVAERVKGAIADARAARTWPELLTGLAMAAVQTLVFGAGLWLLWRIRDKLLGAIARRSSRRAGAAKRPTHILDIVPVVSMGSTIVRAAAMIGAVALGLVWLSLVFAELPWTRPYATRVFVLAAAPFAAFGKSLLDYVPSLFFVFGIGVVTWGAIRLVRIFFRQIETGALAIDNFPDDWAAPTFRLVRLLLLAIALVAIFPYIPGSQSPAFQGVSLFIGFLVSISSSSAISNVIAGTILTYTRAFRAGDMVRVGETTGVVVARSLLVTRVRTPKNLVVTIPNAIVLGGQVTNYTEEARKDGIILNTTVTIGYDAPWRDVHAALVAAAKATPCIAATPEPFVLQTALNDFYVAYELNAYSKEPNLQMAYSALHQSIQDAFNAAGIEIMSPHFSALRDGNTTTIPESSRPAGYEAPRFRVGEWKER